MIDVTGPREGNLPRSERTALYRAFGADGELLYVGISNSVLRRITEHGTTKDWWMNVTRTESEWFPTRVEAEEAERVAIQREHPLHNVQHNQTNEKRTMTRQQKQSLPLVGMPLRERQAVALGMRDGECHVGIIDHVAGAFVTITHYHWMLDMFVGDTRAYLVSEIESIVWADSFREAREEIYEMEPLARFQTKWEKRTSAA